MFEFITANKSSFFIIDIYSMILETYSDITLRIDGNTCY